MISTQLYKLNQVEESDKLAAEEQEQMGYEKLLNLVKPSKEVDASESHAQKKREKKIHAKKMLDSAVTKEESELYSLIAKHR